MIETVIIPPRGKKSGFDRIRCCIDDGGLRKFRSKYKVAISTKELGDGTFGLEIEGGIRGVRQARTAIEKAFGLSEGRDEKRRRERQRPKEQPHAALSTLINDVNQVPFLGKPIDGVIARGWRSDGKLVNLPKYNVAGVLPHDNNYFSLRDSEPGCKVSVVPIRYQFNRNGSYTLLLRLADESDFDGNTLWEDAPLSELQAEALPEEDKSDNKTELCEGKQVTGVYKGDTYGDSYAINLPNGRVVLLSKEHIGRELTPGESVSGTLFPISDCSDGSFEWGLEPTE